jgi:hypothetical protein
MWQQRLTADSRHRKCAKVVGDVMGGYHPHDAFPAGRPTRGGRVTVTYRVGEAETVLTVEDDGIGDPEAAKADGAGIGGMLMSAFAKQVHGELEEGRTPSGGRLMRVRIPRTNGVTGAVPLTTNHAPK